MNTNLNEENVSFYIITLKSKNELTNSKIYNSLSTITNYIKLSKGVILNQKQEEYYNIYPRSSIGITLAHLKIWKKINVTNNFSIIFEDDAILNEKYSYENFWKLINEICKNNSFDIYKLHSDFDNGFTSLAAYIINHNSIDKLLEKL